jgi:hypothetical protein
MEDYVPNQLTNTRRLLTIAVAVLCATASAGTAYATSVDGCASPIYAAARPAVDRVAPIPITENGWRSYSVGAASYLRRCGGYAYANHQIYIDARNLPYGHKVWLTVSTQRSDGKWARAHDAAIVEVTVRRRIEEVIFRQRRGIGGGLAITQIHVRHTATPPGSGAIIPIGSTLKGDYQPWNGPEASPRD